MWGTESGWAWVSGAGGDETRCVVPAPWGDSAGREGESPSVRVRTHVGGCEPLGVHAAHTSPALAPGERGEASVSYLPLFSQVDRHQRARLGACSVVTKTSGSRKDLGTEITVPVKGKRLELGLSKAVSLSAEGRRLL